MSGAGAVVAAGIVGVVAWAFQRYAADQKKTGEYKIVRTTTSGGDSLKRSLLGGLIGVIDLASKGDKQSARAEGQNVFESLFGDMPTVGSIVPFVAKSGDAGSIGDRLMADLQRDFNLTRAQAAGVVGNLDHESGGFKTLQEITPMIPGSRGGWGYAQWTGPRRRDFERWVEQRGLDPRSYAANYGFLKHEMSSTWERRVVPKLRRATGVTEATVVFQDVFLRPGIPHTDSRIARAKRYT